MTVLSRQAGAYRCSDGVAEKASDAEKAAASWISVPFTAMDR